MTLKKLPSQEEMLIMLRWNPFLGCMLVVAVFVGSALAAAKDGADATASAENAASAGQPGGGVNPNVAVTGGSANVTALLGVLVMKGVLAPAEANSIRNVAPDAEFQLLVEALARKGVVSADELSPIAPARPAPVEPAQAAQAPPALAKPAPPKVIPGIGGRAIPSCTPVTTW